jgi:MoxR-like ATPase
MKDFEDLEGITPLVTKEEIIQTQRLATEVYVNDDVVDYLMKIVWATRRHPEIRLGTSTRGAQHLLRAAKAHALVEGRDYTLPEDIKEVAPLVLGHRILLRNKSFIRDAEEIVQEILSKTEVPV